MKRGLVFAALITAGCTLGEGGSDTPMATDGPNQVVIKVPNMT
jgi:hypothetical protein